MTTSFSIATVQAAIFLADGSGFAQSSFLASILAKFSDRYNGNVQALPIPEAPPINFPQVILESADGHWKIQGGPSRIDSFWFATDTEFADIDTILSCSEVLSYYSEANNSLKVGRVGLVLTRVAPSSNPASELITRFANLSLSSTIFGESKDFAVHNHTVSHIEALEQQVNIWMRCKTGRLLPSQDPALIIEQDINTLEEDKDPTRFPPDRIRAFFSEAVNLSELVFQQYFPE